jgi:hypothetical protein
MESTTIVTKKILELDGLPQEFDCDKTFGAISSEVKTLLAPSRVMTDIFVDGKAVDIYQEETLNRETFKNLGTVVLKSRDVNELFRESLSLAPRICEAMELDCTDIVNFIDAGNMQQAQERIGELTSLLEWLLQLIGGVQSLGKQKLEEMNFSGGKVIDTVNKMQFLLAKLHLHMSAQQWKDFQIVLQGDFAKEIKVWSNLFNEFSKIWSPRSSSRES